MNIRDTGARSARRVTTVLGVAGAALASIIGVSVWAGTAAAASGSSNGTSTVQQGDDGGQGDGGGFGTSNSFGNGSVGPGQGGGSHGNSSGS